MPTTHVSGQDASDFLEASVATQRTQHIREAARRALERCDRIAACTTTPGVITRTFLAPPMREVHALLAEWMSAAGVPARVDAIGNLIGTWRGGDASRRLLIGSHLDTVPCAGRYDGVLGVMLGLAAVEVMSAAGFTAAFDVDVVGFSEEEGVRFGRPYLGSMALAGMLDDATLALCDADGCTVREAIGRFGLDPDCIADAACARDPRRPIGYLEVHIEQGPVLDALERPLGIVTAIAGQSRLRIRFDGQAQHAGTCPMPLRRDALAAAAEFITAVEAVARGTDGLVATVGRIEVSPGASNVVPGAAELSLDVRHADDAVRRRALDELLVELRAIDGRRGVQTAVLSENHHHAVPMDAGLQDILAGAAVACGLSPHRMVSGAGHDAAVMASVCPAGMLFVRSPGGISHHPDESVGEDDVADALAVLVESIVRLSERSDS